MFTHRLATPTASEQITFNAEAAEGAEKKCPRISQRALRALRSNVVFLIAFILGSGAAFAQGPNFGKPISPAEIAAWDISIMPDGSGLPPGSGTPADGSRIYVAKCAMCHGPDGKGGLAAALVGGNPLTSGIDTTKTIANFWPYATTLFDY